MKLSLLPFYFVSVIITVFIILFGFIFLFSVISEETSLNPVAVPITIGIGLILIALGFYIFSEAIIRLLKRWKSIQ